MRLKIIIYFGVGKTYLQSNDFKKGVAKGRQFQNISNVYFHRISKETIISVRLTHQKKKLKMLMRTKEEQEAKAKSWHKIVFW